MDKICRKCKASKSLSEFFKNRLNKDGYGFRCKLCNYEDIKNWRKKNPKAASISAKRFRTENPDAYYNGQYKSKYGITLNQYNQMFNKQDGKCKICKIDSKLLDRKLAIDHCHKTLKVRGLLCGNCNKGIGSLQESVTIIKNALNYIMENN